jgi:hypothetical protein
MEARPAYGLLFLLNPTALSAVSIRRTWMAHVASGSLEPVSDRQQSDALKYDSDWESWFAWRPVRLYMTGGLAWFRFVHRRDVSRSGIATRDYTDRPDLFATPGFEP